MLKILGRLLKNKDGFTATEIGLMAALTVIAVERLLTRFQSVGPAATWGRNALLRSPRPRGPGRNGGSQKFRPGSPSNLERMIVGLRIYGDFGLRGQGLRQ